MPRISTKKTTENKSIENSVNSLFSKDCFVNGFPLEEKSGEDIPMWWSAVRESGVSFKQYKKDKKRAEKEIAGLEDYLKKLEEENKRYTEKLKKESEKYKLECDMKSHAFDKRRKQEELILATEKEEAKKRVLEEKLQIQASKFEQDKERAKISDQLREEEAQLRYKESLAQIEQEENEERQKMLGANGIKNSTVQKGSKNQVDRQKRIALESAVESSTVKKLKRNHKAKDYEFVYPRPVFGGKNNDTVIEFSALCIKSKKNLKHCSSPVYAEIGKGITVSRELSKREMRAVCYALTRQLPNDLILSGGTRYKNEYLLHEMTKKKQNELLLDKVNIVSEDNASIPKLKTIGSYLREKIDSDNFDTAIQYLQRLNVKGAKGLMKKLAFACLESEIQKVVVVSALLSNSEITVLCEPQRKFDPQSENAFWQLVSEWQGGKDGRVLWVLTSSEEFEK